MAEQNSLQTILPELLRLFNNSLESFEKVNEAITSSRKSVTINVQGSDGTNSRVTIPSFGFLKNSIERLDYDVFNNRAFVKNSVKALEIPISFLISRIK